VTLIVSVALFLPSQPVRSSGGISLLYKTPYLGGDHIVDTAWDV
jgi:hypothetical protein